MIAQEMLGLAEAAQQLRKPYQDAYRLLLLGRLRGEKRGSRWFVRRDDVDRLAREHDESDRRDDAFGDVT